MKRKDILITFSGVFISFILIYFTFKNVNIKTVFNIIKKADPFFIWLFFFSTFFELFFRTIKWYLILKPIVKTDLIQLFKIEIISLGVNNILPFRMGELTKMFIVARMYLQSKTTILSTVFIERLLDSLILFTLLVLYSTIGNINILINDISFLIFLNTIIVFIIIGFKYMDKILEIKKIKKLEETYPKFHLIILKIKNGGVCFKNLWYSLLIFLVGIIQWNFDVLNNFFTAKALNMEVIDYFKAAITVFAGSLSASIPSMPGYFGNYEYAVSQVCISWGIEKELAISFATLTHILSYLIITIAAVIFVYDLGFNFKKILSMKKEE